VDTFLGSGKGGDVDGPAIEAEFHEPGGLSISSGTIYVADTDNNAIRVIGIQDGNVKTLKIKSSEAFKIDYTGEGQSESRQLPTQNVTPGDNMIYVSVELPDGYRRVSVAPSFVRLKSEDVKVINFDGKQERIYEMPEFPLKVWVNSNVGKTSLKANFVIRYCRTREEQYCQFTDVTFNVPVNVGKKNRTKEIPIVYTGCPTTTGKYNIQNR
jgi:hypothetical protein